MACAAQKRPHPAPARELYASRLFRLASTYAERTCSAWFILSARHGLVEPGTVLAPYDLRLDRLGSAQRSEWAQRVLDDLRGRGLDTPALKWVVLAGRLYRAGIVPHLQGRVEVPLAGLGIGQQVARLAQMLRE